MNYYEHTPFASPVRTLTPEQPANFITWRDEWRAEVAARRGGANHNEFAKPKSAASLPPARPERSKAANFAAAIARNEFGRFYWNGKLARQLAQTLAAGPPKRRAGTAKPARWQRPDEAWNQNHGDRPTTAASLTVTSAVSAAAASIPLISLACVGVSAWGEAGGAQ
jgi:hypothetical protein